MNLAKSDKKDRTRKKATRLHASKKQKKGTKKINESSDSEEEVEQQYSSDSDDYLPRPKYSRFSLKAQQKREEEEAFRDYEEVMAEQERLRADMREFHIRSRKRMNIFLHVCLCFVCQIVLVIAIGVFLLEKQSAQFIEPITPDVMFCRFICGTILHLSLIDEVMNGLSNMKFALNHQYVFKSWLSAWTVGFLQTVIVILVEVVNIEIILTSTDPLNIVYNFISIAIIAEFDDFVFSALRNEPMK
jgi:hypothetical protein